VQLYYQIGLVGQRDLDLAPDPRSGFEMVMLRMLTFRPVGTASAPAKPVQVRQPINKPQAQPASNQAQPVHHTAVTTQPAIVAETTAQETVVQ